jgi:hypothetical protein
MPKVFGKCHFSWLCSFEIAAGFIWLVSTMVVKMWVALNGGNYRKLQGKINCSRWVYICVAFKFPTYQYVHSILFGTKHIFHAWMKIQMLEPWRYLHDRTNRFPSKRN